MSEYPVQLEALLRDARREHEPDPARLRALHERIVRAPRSPRPEFDLAPPRPGPRWGAWVTLGSAVLTTLTLLLVLREVRPEPLPPQQRAPVVEARAEPPLVPYAELPEPALGPRPEPRGVVERARPEVPAPPREVPRAPSPALSSAARTRKPRAAPAVAPAPSAPDEAVAAAPEGTSSPQVASMAALERELVTEERERASTASLQREVKLIAEARRALARGDLRGAEAALDEHRLEHPSGQLQAERAALRARARCMAGDLDAARRLRDELALVAPRSALLASLVRACPALAP